MGWQVTLKLIRKIRNFQYTELQLNGQSQEEDILENEFNDGRCKFKIIKTEKGCRYYKCGKYYYKTRLEYYRKEEFIERIKNNELVSMGMNLIVDKPDGGYSWNGSIRSYREGNLKALYWVIES
ncbi:MAG: hypothetical protein IJ165_01025 [Proteobacteria bacterium]|nr:hypothetical protein [Pseudomonadota bacterium]